MPDTKPAYPDLDHAAHRRRKNAFISDEIHRLLSIEDPVDYYAQAEPFRSLLNTAADLGISFTEIADEITTSKANVSRWAGGKSLPPIHGRIGVVHGVLKLLDRQLRAVI